MREAKCKKNKYCSFTDRKEYPDAIREACIFCGRKIIWNKDEFGRIDNRKYARFHVRDFAQPQGPTARIFREIYGTIAEEQLAAFRAKNRQYGRDSWDLAAEDSKRMIRDMRKEAKSI